MWDRLPVLNAVEVSALLGNWRSSATLASAELGAANRCSRLRRDPKARNRSGRELFSLINLSGSLKCVKKKHHGSVINCWIQLFSRISFSCE